MAFTGRLGYKRNEIEKNLGVQVSDWYGVMNTCFSGPVGKSWLKDVEGSVILTHASPTGMTRPGGSCPGSGSTLFGRLNFLLGMAQVGRAVLHKLLDSFHG